MTFSSICKFMARLGGYMLGVLMLIQFSCASQSVLSMDSTYYEDLSMLRPKYENPVDSAEVVAHNNNSMPITNFEPIANVNETVDAVLDSLDELNATKRYVDGFTIQLYSGPNREEAVDARNKALNVASTLPHLEYTQPKFRVIIGSYFTELEAQPDLYLLRRTFPNAILVPEPVAIR